MPLDPQMKALLDAMVEAEIPAFHTMTPVEARKMTARLDEANASSNPILLRTSKSAGHGIGTALSERIKQQADMYSFLFTQLGMSASPK